MRYFDFEQKMLRTPVFTSKEVKTVCFDEPNILVQVAFWVKKGYIRRVEKGVYVLAKKAEEVTTMEIASKLYPPSYISLEFALNYHGIIPDVPFTVTSITARKTKTFRNDFGCYAYRHVKSELFSGYAVFQQNGISVYMAVPEKALFDFVYLNRERVEPSVDFWEEMRLDEEASIDAKKLRGWADTAGVAKVSECVESILRYYDR